MVEWSRSALSVLGAYALVQLLIYALVLTGDITRPVRGFGAHTCADTAFTLEGATSRITLFDTTPYLAPPYSRAINNGEEVFRQLSLLREATRDGWVHFAGDGTLKQAYYEYLSIMQKNGIGAPVSVKVAKKRLAARHEKDDARVGSSKLTFRYAPLYADLARDWEKLWKEVIPPSLVIMGAGSFDALNRTKEATAIIEAEQDALVEAIRARLQVRVDAGQKVPVVLVLSPPRFSDSAASTLSSQSRLAIERAEELTERLKEKLRLTSFALQSTSSGKELTPADGPAPPLVQGPIAFADIRSLATPLHGRVTEYVDDTLRVLLNPANNAVSLAAYTSCALGQPSWELRSFTPGQISLAGLWAFAVCLWMYGQVQSRFGSGASRGAYHRVSASDASEIELGQAGNGATVGAGALPKATPPVDHATPSASLLAYFSTPAWNNVLACFVQFGCVLIFIFLMDGNQRISWSIIGDKQYVRDTFLFLLVVIGLLAWRSMSVTSDGGDALLNREQTEEWKGWMQILFVLYHYFAAKEMYNLIRIFIAAYVWMTGYGNFFFFYKTNDYSFARSVEHGTYTWLSSNA
jgi:hypothetical protein